MDCKEKELVNEDMNRAADALESVGFVVMDRTPAGELESVVGYEIVEDAAELRVSAERAGLLREALRWTVAQAWVDIGLLATLLGQWVWGALLRRELLSVPRDIFKLCERYEKQRVRGGLEPEMKQRAWPSSQCSCRPSCRGQSRQ